MAGKQGMLIYYAYFHDRRFVPIHVSELVGALAREGARVRVFTSVDPDLAARAFNIPEVTVTNLRAPEVRFFSEPLFAALLFPALAASFAKNRPDILYTRHGAASLAACLAGKLLGVPCLVELNDIMEDKIAFANASLLKKAYVRLYHFANLRLASRILPVTEEIHAHYAKKHGLPRERFFLSPNGVNADRFSPKPKDLARKNYGIPEETKVVLSLGSLFPWAGLETLVAAAPKILEKHPDTLFVIGSGEEPGLSRLKTLARDAGLGEKFLFHGFIPWDEAAFYISMADLCAAPFIFRNTRSGIASLRVLAYMACARPVAGSDIPGLGDMLERTGAGLSVHMDDPEALALAVIRLLDAPGEARAMGEKGRVYILENLSWRAIARRVLGCAETLAQKDTR
jgi:glycosyltransferase involved in cell wall biosynthesis